MLGSSHPTCGKSLTGPAGEGTPEVRDDAANEDSCWRDDSESGALHDLLMQFPFFLILALLLLL